MPIDFQAIPEAFAQENGLLPPNSYRYQSLGELVPALIRIAFLFGGIITLFVTIWGGFKFILSGGDGEKRQNAKNTIIAGIIGLTIIVLTPMILNLLAAFFGLSLDIPDFTNLTR